MIRQTIKGKNHMKKPKIYRIVKCAGCWRNARVKNDEPENNIAFCSRCKNKKPCSQCGEYTISKDSWKTICKTCEKGARYNQGGSWASSRISGTHKRQGQTEFWRESGRRNDRNLD
jgi:formylmethanofuran dehydrogenase subunit E